MDQAGVKDPAKCLFVDDTLENIEGGKRVGWIRSVYFREQEPMGLWEQDVDHTRTGQGELPIEDKIHIINDLQQLRSVWSDVFVQAGQ
jgi:pyrimidine and pyridine-specific 5'-nucleotidase